MNALPRLYAIADASFGDPVQLAASLIAGGARLIQLRDKNASSRELLHTVDRVIAFAPSDVRVIVNDRVDIGRCECDDPVLQARTWDKRTCRRLPSDRF